jgi:hypothetical protein
MKPLNWLGIRMVGGTKSTGKIDIDVKNAAHVASSLLLSRLAEGKVRKSYFRRWKTRV